MSTLADLKGQLASMQEKQANSSTVCDRGQQRQMNMLQTQIDGIEKGQRGGGSSSEPVIVFT